jgi:hypothetical protein
MLDTNEAISVNIYEVIAEYQNQTDDTYDPSSYIDGIDVIAYSITDENYIQIFYTVSQYPNYGTAGDLYGFVYDIASDDYIDIGEFIESIGSNGEKLTADIHNSYTAANPSYTIGSIFLRAFYLTKAPDGGYNHAFLFEMEVQEYEDGDPYKGFYMYTPADGEIFEMNSDQLFDPSSVDEYDPPLYCQEGWSSDQGDVIPASDTFGLLQGDYYYKGDEAAAHFTFYGTENVDAYYGSGSYETSYTLSALPDIEVTDDSGYTYNEVSFEMYDANGDYAFLLKTTDAAPGSFELYDKDGYFIAEYININI